MVLVGADQRTFKRVLSQESITNENSKKAVPKKESSADDILKIRIVGASSVRNSQEIVVLEEGLKNAQLPSDIDDSFFASSSYRTLAMCSNLTNDVPLSVRIPFS